MGSKAIFYPGRIVDGETIEDMDETDFEPQQQQLHAKLFVGEYGRRIQWYLGSANCTDPAFTCNIEFMVGLEGENNTVGPDAVLSALINTNGDSVIFKPFEPVAEYQDTETENIRQLIRHLEYQLINTPLTGQVLAREKMQNYDLRLTMDTRNVNWDHDIMVRLALLNMPQNVDTIGPGTLNNVEFENLREVDLSVFAVITISFQRKCGQFIYRKNAN